MSIKKATRHYNTDFGVQVRTPGQFSERWLQQSTT